MNRKALKRIAAAALASAMAAVPLISSAEAGAPVLEYVSASIVRSLHETAASELPEKDAAVPDGYNAHDYLKLRSFLELTDDDGTPNWEKLNIGGFAQYDPDVPETWSNITWTDSDTDKQVAGVSFMRGSENLYGELDLGGCTSLEILYITFGNHLDFLDVSGCTALNLLVCESNELTAINLYGCASLDRLTCSGNNISFLDVSGSPKLTKLSCSRNILHSLDVGNNTELQELSCSDNQLTSLDIGANTKLRLLNCGSNQLESLDVSKNPELFYIECPRNMLETLDVGNNAKLETLNCSENRISELDVSGNPLLTTLECSFNPIKTLDLSNNTELTSFEYMNPMLTELDLSKNAKLEQLRLDAGYNGDAGMLKSVDLSGCPELYSVYCGFNQIEKLDVSANTKLAELSCGSNLLSSLDVSKNPELLFLDCSRNPISSLDLSNNTSLYNLTCHQTQLTSLDLSHCNVYGVTSIRAEGSGYIGLYRTNTNILSVSLVPGCFFEGWYSPSGELLTRDYDFIIAAYNYDVTDYVAKFSGEPTAPSGGDVDGDGSITVTDALSAVRSAMSLLGLTPEQAAAADMDGDGRITVGDGLTILRMAMELI